MCSYCAIIHHEQASMSTHCSEHRRVRLSQKELGGMEAIACIPG